MGDLSANFSRSEFACPCGCGFDTVDFALVNLLQKFRDFIERPVTVTSGCRCPEYNAQVGGSENSQHLYARAADIVVEHVPPEIVHEYFDGLNTPGLGKYDTFTHIDTRSGPKARW
jgi:uncharacterized protein YcbK (DUF882 family)